MIPFAACLSAARRYSVAKMSQPVRQGPLPDFLPDAVAHALGISGAVISTAPQGMTSEVAFVDDRGRKSVLKRCRNPVYIEWLRREHRVLVALSGCGLRIPRVIGCHEIREDGHVADAWLLMTRLPGASLWEVLLGAGPDERIRHFRILGTFLRELHSTPPPDVFRGDRPWIDRMLEQARKNLEWSEGSQELLVQLETTRPSLHPDVLIHGDLALDNVLIDQDGSMSLIDWSGGGLGDPRYDVALALGTEPEIELRQADIEAFFDGYGGTPMDADTTRWFTRLYDFF
jgi:aminoglycoside phosphotransferase (APT) family kinase protein